MQSKWVIIMALLFVVGALLGGILEAQYITSDKVTILNVFARVQTVDYSSVLGAVSSIPAVASDTIQAMVNMLTWDYSFFHDVDPVTGVQTANGWTIFRYLGWCISLGMLIPFFVGLIGVIRGS
jgi:hypothetical protein